jgi:hypothetical protein
MNAKTLKIIFISLWLIVFFNCKNLVRSDVDQPREDYNLLALLNQKVLNGFFWEGIMEYSTCDTPSTDPVQDLTACSVYQTNYNNLLSLRDKNLFVIVDSLTSTGKISIEITNPSTYLPLKVEIPVSASVSVGPETGNGYARILKLVNPSPITQDSATITLRSFQADVLEDGLRGTLSIDVQSGSSSLSLTFSFNIKKVY